MHSVRAKLYTMSKDGEDGTGADGTWKERGTGTLRVNVPKDLRAQAQGGGARLGESISWGNFVELGI